MSPRPKPLGLWDRHDRLRSGIAGSKHKRVVLNIHHGVTAPSCLAWLQRLHGADIKRHELLHNNPALCSHGELTTATS